MSAPARWRGRMRAVLPYSIAAASGFLLAYVVVFFFVFPARLVPDDATVPDVKGLPFDAAARRLRQAGFEAKKGEERYHATVAAGAVLTQTPPATSSLPRGTMVTVTISRGQLVARVPSVIGLPRHLAETAVTNAGLDMGNVRTEESEAPRGEVIAVRPGEGMEVPVPARVSLVVSAGPATMIMPDVMGQSYPQARVLLEQLGLRPGTAVMDSLSMMVENTVIAQFPLPGTDVARGARVELTVAGRQP